MVQKTGQEAGCRSCGNDKVAFRCTRCKGEYCDGCIHEFGGKAAQALVDRVYGKGTMLGGAKIFDDQDRAFCPDCYGKLLDPSLKTGQWVIHSPDEAEPSVVRVETAVREVMLMYLMKKGRKHKGRQVEV